MRSALDVRRQAVATRHRISTLTEPFQPIAEKGASGGYAELDAAGDVPDDQIPSGVTRDADLGALATLDTVGTTQVDDGAVTYAKLQDVSATDKVLGRSSVGAGDVEELACTAAGRALLAAANAAAQRVALGIPAPTDWTPTIADKTNVTTDVVTSARYATVGKQTTIWIRGTVNVTASGAASAFTITLPVAQATNTLYAIGPARVGTVVTIVEDWTGADATRVGILWTSSGTGVQAFHATLTYESA